MTSFTLPCKNKKRARAFSPVKSVIVSKHCCSLLTEFLVIEIVMDMIDDIELRFGRLGMLVGIERGTRVGVVAAISS